MGFRTWIYKHTGIKLRKFDRYYDQRNYCKIMNITLEKNADVHNIYGVGRNVTIGAYSYIFGATQVISETTIGKYCAIAHNCTIGLIPHPTDWLSIHPFQYNFPLIGDIFPGIQKNFTPKKPLPVHIGNDVWIGLSAIIHSGITIGNGAIIGAGSVVTKDVPPYAIVGGTPAKIIRYRFDDSTIQELLNIEWWNIDKEDLLNAKIDFDHIHQAIQQIKELKLQHR